MRFTYLRRNLVYKYIMLFICTFFIISVCLPVVASAQQAPLELKSGWKYRWGDCEVNEKGVPVWVASGLEDPAWKSLDGIDGKVQNEAGYHVVWLAIKLPEGNWEDPTIVIDTFCKEFYVYIDQQLVYDYSNKSFLGYDPSISLNNRLSVPLKPDYSSKILFIKVSGVMGSIGVGSGKEPILLALVGSYQDIVKELVSTTSVPLFLGSFFFIFAIMLLPVTVFLTKKEKKTLIVLCIFVACIGIWELTLYPLINFLIFSNAVVIQLLCYLTVFAIPSFLVYFFEQLFGPGYKGFMTRLWQTDMVFLAAYILLVLSGIAFGFPVGGQIRILLNFFYVKIIIDFLLITVRTVKNAIKGDIDARIVTGAFVIFAVTSVADVSLTIYFNNFTTASISRWSLLILVAAFVLVIGRRFFDVHRRLVVYANELEAKNQKLNDSKNEIEILNKTLEQRVIERTRQLEEANVELKDINEELTFTMETLRDTQKQLIQSEKLAALGGLVAGVAHEINTPVGIGVTAASHLELKTKDISQLYNNNKIRKSDLGDFLNICNESTRLILSNLNRASELVKNFKQIAVDQSTEERRLFKIKDYIDKVLMSLSPKLNETKVKIEFNCQSELELYGYPGAFSQIITNLVMNSLIHGYNKGDQGIIRFEIKREEDTMIFKYSDNGKGIDPKIIGKIFDPFFTTKRSAGGTGLGLNIIYNIVTQKFKGTIECESELGKGCTFIMSIPLLESRA